jgi:hypothetical protein
VGIGMKRSIPQRNNSSSEPTARPASDSVSGSDQTLSETPVRRLPAVKYFGGE